MTLYTVAYGYIGNIRRLDSEKLRKIFHSHINRCDCYAYCVAGGFYGPAYMETEIFTDIRGAQAYINKDYYTASQYQWKPDLVR